jgi:hypothetical protein
MGACAVLHSAALSFSQSAERTPGRYGLSARFATTPSTPSDAHGFEHFAGSCVERSDRAPCGTRQTEGFERRAALSVRPRADRLAVDDEQIERDEGHIAGGAARPDASAHPVGVARKPGVGDELTVEDDWPAPARP